MPKNNACKLSKSKGERINRSSGEKEIIFDEEKIY